MKHILKCNNCGDYTIKDLCIKCGRKTVRPIPPKYNPLDKYGQYRRKVKFSSLKEAGLV